MSQLTSGEVKITLAGEPRVLKPSLGAFTRLASKYGNFRALIEKLGETDVDAICTVLRQGLGITSDADTKRLPEQVFQTGVASLVAPLIDWTFRLFNSGKSPEEVIDEQSKPGDTSQGNEHQLGT